MIERNIEAYLKVHREERERATTHIVRLREARHVQASAVVQETGVAADRPARIGAVRHLARIVLARLDHPLRP